MSFDIKFTRLGFENACCIARQASRCQQAFSKPCLVNLISKDTHLVISKHFHLKYTFAMLYGMLSTNFSYFHFGLLYWLQVIVRHMHLILSLSWTDPEGGDLVDANGTKISCASPFIYSGRIWTNLYPATSFWS